MRSGIYQGALAATICRFSLGVGLLFLFGSDPSLRQVFAKRRQFVFKAAHRRGMVEIQLCAPGFDCQGALVGLFI